MKREKALRIWLRESFLKDESTLSVAALQEAVDSLHPEEVRPSLSAAASLGSFYDRNGIERPETAPQPGKRAAVWKKWALSGSCLALLLVCLAAVPSFMKKSNSPAEEEIAFCSVSEERESGRKNDGLQQELSVVGTYGAADQQSSINSAALDESQLERLWDFLRSVDIFNAFDSPMSFCTEESDSAYEIVLDVSFRNDAVEIVFSCDSENAYKEMKEENSFVRFFEKLLSLFSVEESGIIEY